MPRVKHCRNREIVNAEGRLYSPKYDWEGADGLAQSSFEFIDADAMCFWGVCDSDSYNAWAKATNKFIEDKLVVQYKKVLGRAQAHYQGAPLPADMQDRFNNIAEFIQAWDESGIKPDKDWSDTLLHPFAPYWWGKIRTIVEFFDDAACAYDELVDIAADELNSPALVPGLPKRTLEPSPTGSYLDGSGGLIPGGGNSRSPTATALGIMAIGAAGYFGYKVLTE